MTSEVDMNSLFDIQGKLGDQEKEENVIKDKYDDSVEHNLPVCEVDFALERCKSRVFEMQSKSY